jgi:hypothetical protein
MNRFTQFNITVTSKSFIGDKMKISKIIGKEIIVHDFRIEQSKVEEFRKRGSDKCLHLQIEYNGEKCVVFTSSKWLIEAIENIPEGGLPFQTVIIKEDERCKFT